MLRTLRIQITVAVNSRGFKQSSGTRGSIHAKHAPICGWDKACCAFSQRDSRDETLPEEVSIDQIAADYALFEPEEEEPLVLTTEEFDQIGVTRSEEIPCDPYDPEHIDTYYL